LASSEGAFHTPSTSLSAAAGRTAEAVLTVGPALTEEAASVEGLRQTGDPFRRRTEERKRIGAVDTSAGGAMTAGAFQEAKKPLRRGRARSFRISWNAEGEEQHQDPNHHSAVIELGFAARSLVKLIENLVKSKQIQELDRPKRSPPNGLSRSLQASSKKPLPKPSSLVTLNFSLTLWVTSYP